jgi:lipopolysaccharide/colanic/teichoic acid biosynthesis glycosyltransferase
MKTLKLKQRNRWNWRSLSKGETSIGDGLSGVPAGSRLYPEELFAKLYHQECKRSERSSMPFLLMLIDVSCLIAAGPSRHLESIENFLEDSTRDYDLKGWYRAGRIIGIIFAEHQCIEGAVLKERILRGFRTAPGSGPVEMPLLKIYRIRGISSEKIDIDMEESGKVEKIRRKNDSRCRSGFRKRMVDIIGAAFGIVIFSPFFLMIAILVKATSRGPVFFGQERIGKDGMPFQMLKFRSMYVDNDDSPHREFVTKLIQGEIRGASGELGEKIYKIRNDPRVTPIGRLIRKTSLDELPQFFNVLKGDMSLVGPRPALSYEVAQYDLWHRRRVSAKPGITGLWQVEGRSHTTFDGMVRMDIRYIERWSVLLDLLLIIKTPFSLVSAKGAY